jgi:hypothetical protein
VALVALAVGCGGGDDDTASSSTTTTEPATTSTTVDPEAAFLAEVNANSTGSGSEAELVDLGWSICDALDSVAGVFTDDAPNDTPETDAQIAHEAVALGLDQVMAADLEDAFTAVVMRAAGGELCPERYGMIIDYLAER